MATKAKTASSAPRSSRRIGLSVPQSPLQLMETTVPTGKQKVAAAPNAVPADSNDPTGIKAYIAFSVAHALYPQGSGIDPDQDISDDVKLNAASIAAEVNVDAQHAATIHQLTWTPVTTDNISGLDTVSSLIALIKGNMSSAASS